MSGRSLIGGSETPWHGGQITDRAVCILAPNPGPMTLDGTNTWVLGTADSRDVIVVDPGPDDVAHLERVYKHVQQRNARVHATLLTHGHSDHSAGARLWHELTNAPVLALDPQHRYGSAGLQAGDHVSVGDLSVQVVETPGHSGDSVCFAYDGFVLTGDTVLGRGTTVVAWPDGNLAAYLESLALLTDVIDRVDAQMLLPGHGPVLSDPAGVIAAYLDHRHERLGQVRDAMRAGAATAADVVSMVYTDIPDGVRQAAEMSAQAQLDYLLP